MSNQLGIISNERPQRHQISTVSRKRVLVFSPDSDLARFLLLNLEDEFQIVREHQLDHFEQAVKDISPDLILIDLFTFSQTSSNNSISCAVRTYSSNHRLARLYAPYTEMNKSIDDLTDAVF